MQLHLTKLMTDSGTDSNLDNSGTSLAVPSLLGIQPSLKLQGVILYLVPRYLPGDGHDIYLVIIGQGVVGSLSKP